MARYQLRNNNNNDVSHVEYRGGNSTTAEEVSKFQHLFSNPQLVDARKGI